jgi:hypothetical protein
MYNDFGFFRDLYLFRSGVRLTPYDVWEISDIVGQLKWLAKLRSPERRMIEFSFPQSIQDFYPRELQSFPGTGLASLRQVARPAAERKGGLPEEAASGLSLKPASQFPVDVGIPQRHFVGHQ